MQEGRGFAWKTVSSVIALAVLLIGCGGGDAPPESTEAQPPEPDVAALEAAIAELPSEEELERIVAEVNGNPITARRVFEVTQVNRTRLEAQGKIFTEADEHDMRRQALSLIIDDELLVQAAEAEGLEVAPERVDQQIEEIRGRLGSEEAFRSYLDNAGITEDGLREESRRRLLTQAMLDALSKDLEVDDETLRQIYEENKERFSEGEEIRGSYILVKSSKTDPEEKRQAARTRIDEALTKIRAGEAFADVAREYSEANNASKGGDLGFFPRGVMVPQFEDVAFNMQPGDVSDVFETPFGLNIVTVTDRKEATPKPFEQVKPVLMLDVAQFQKSMVIQAKIAELREKAEIKILDDSFAADAVSETAPTGS